MTALLHADDQPMNWVGNWVGHWAAVAPDRPALLDAGSGARYSYGELNQRANRLAHWLLHDAGLKPGDRICILLRNRIEALDFYLACGKTGIILAPLSFRLRPRELNDLLQRIQPALLVHEDVFDDLAKALTTPQSMVQSLQRTLRLAEGDDAYERELLGSGPPGPPGKGAGQGAGQGAEMNRPLAMSDTFLYIHTGGTTATPKVCIVPYRQMVWNSLDLMVTGGGTLSARTLITFPFFHIGGWNSLTPILHGGGYAVLMRQFDPAELLQLISRERIRNFGGVEAMFRFIIANPAFAQADLSSLEAVTSAGAPCAEAVMKAFHDRGIPITQAYGLTEAGPSNFSYAPVTDDLEEIWRHNRSIGTSMPHCDYQIIDRDTREPVAPGETGVLCMRSLHSFDGYLDQPERTASMLLPDGWVYSGDLAREDAEGFVTLVGRADNMFISGGENVSPEEIENVIMAWPEVQQAAVIAVDDQRWGQVPLAVVVAARVDEADDALRERLLAFCRSELASFKVPHRIEFVDALPVTGAGKIDRNAIAERFA